MRRALFPALTIMMLLATGTGMIAVSLLLAPGAADSRDSARAAAVVRQFYTLANDAIAAGNATAIDAVVAPGADVRVPLPVPPTGREGLHAFLAALHTLAPGLHLEASDIVATGDRVVAHVTISGGGDAGNLEGLIVERSPLWGDVDTFRVAGGAITDFWSGAEGTTLVWPLARNAFTVPVAAPWNFALQRVTLAPGARWHGAPGLARLLLGEEGSIRLTSELAMATPAARAKGVVLSTGQALMVPPGVTFDAANEDAIPARFLAATVSNPLPPGEGSARAAEPTTAVVQTLAGGLAVNTPVGAQTLALSRVALSRDARISLAAMGGPVLVTLESGHADALAGGSLWLRRGTDGTLAQAQHATLQSGDGLLLQPGGLLALTVTGDEPAVALVLALRPEASAP